MLVSTMIVDSISQCPNSELTSDAILGDIVWDPRPKDGPRSAFPQGRSSSAL